MLGQFRLGLVALGVMCSAGAMAQQPLGSAFTYQGRLNSSGAPASGLHELEFGLYDATSDGAQAGTTVTREANVDGGLFSVSLDFGAGAFNGQKRYLEVQVRPSGGSAYTTLWPRTEVSPAPHAVFAEDFGEAGLSRVLPRSGSGYEIVRVTSSPTANAANLVAAYAKAKTLQPHGMAPSASNRVSVILPPATYDFQSSQFTLDTNFIDLVGLTPKRDSQKIVGLPDSPGEGVLGQTAPNVHIEGLTVISYAPDTGLTDSTEPAAYFPNSNMPETIVRNCKFEAPEGGASMRYGTEYSGKYIDCESGISSFGRYSGGAASGTFINCTAEAGSFGVTDTVASGTFINCTAGLASFGSLSSTASGTFRNCKASHFSFASMLSVASGTFENCTAGDSSFGSSGSADGTFIHCKAGTDSFGAFSNGGKFSYCTAESSSFGAALAPGGTYLHCNAMVGSFGQGTRAFCTVNGVPY